MQARRDRWFFLLVLVCQVTLISFPYLFAANQSDERNVFAGLLLNPIDGNSYLAKMYQGWQGHWLFELLYTAESGDRRFLFTYYIFLGQAARWLNLPLVAVYHLARVCGATFMLWALYKYFKTIFPTMGRVWLGLVLVALGSGAGWIAALFGMVTADFWVAEAYPFLSAYTNPHFPLGLGLSVWLMTPKPSVSHSQSSPVNLIHPGNIHWSQWASILTCSFLLSLVSPFGIVLVLVVVCGEAVWELIDRWRAVGWRSVYSLPGLPRILTLLLGGGPVLLYDLWIVRVDPLLSGWNAQNLTPSPPLWDLAISFAPVLMGGGCYFLLLMRDRSPNPLEPAEMLFSIRRKNLRMVIVWACLGSALLFVPFSLQRRFLMGLYVPWSVLTVETLLGHLRRVRWRKLFLSGLFIAALPTNIFIIIASLRGAAAQDPRIFLSVAEKEALEWISSHAPVGAVILASPDTSLFIPAHTGRHVVYGHPFETVQASEKKILVERFFREQAQHDGVAAIEQADIIFWGPREQLLGPQPDWDDKLILFKNSTVTLVRNPR
jgi:hypothetical protein